MIYLITPTSDRPVQLQFCIELMSRQTYSGDVTWVISDDSQHHIEIPTVKNWKIIHKKNKHNSGNSQSSNLIEALVECDKNSKIIVIEDDDYYSEKWLDVISTKLETAHIAGEVRTKYYNLSNSTYKINGNRRHSSLCSTGINSPESYDSLLNTCKNRHKFIDIHFWHNFPHAKNLFRGDDVVGIKGLPGKFGIGMGHRGRLNNTDDENHSMLIKWIGDEWAKKYISVMSN